MSALEHLKKDIVKLEVLSREAHRQRHIELHKSLDELLADFIDHTGQLPSYTNIMDLCKWAYEQTLEPTPSRDAL